MDDIDAAGRHRLRLPDLRALSRSSAFTVVLRRARFMPSVCHCGSAGGPISREQRASAQYDPDLRTTTTAVRAGPRPPRLRRGHVRSAPA